MGSAAGGFWRRIRRFTLSGHQCWFAVPPTAWCAVFITGQVAADGSSLVTVVPCSSLLMSLPDGDEGRGCLRIERCSPAGSGAEGQPRRRAPTGGALTPVDDFGLVDVVA